LLLSSSSNRPRPHRPLHSFPTRRSSDLIPGICRCLPSDVRVPHLGWNAVTAAGEGLVATGVAAFANSYALREAPAGWVPAWTTRSEEHTSELQSRGHLVCRLLLEKKK